MEALELLQKEQWTPEISRLQDKQKLLKQAFVVKLLEVLDR